MRLDLARKETAGERVVDDNVEAVAPARQDELGLKRAGDGVVHALVDGGQDPVVVLARHDDLGDFERGEVGDAEADKLAGFVQVVDGREGFGKGGFAVLFTGVCQSPYMPYAILGRGDRG